MEKKLISLAPEQALLSFEIADPKFLKCIYRTFMISYSQGSLTGTLLIHWQSWLPGSQVLGLNQIQDNLIVFNSPTIK